VPSARQSIEFPVDLRDFFQSTSWPNRGFSRAGWMLAYRQLHALAGTTWPFQRVRGLTSRQIVFDGHAWRIRHRLNRSARFTSESDPDVFSSGAVARDVPSWARTALHESVVATRRLRRPEAWERKSLRSVFCRVMRRPPAHVHVSRILTTELPARVRADLRAVLPGLDGPRWFGDVIPFLRALKAEISTDGRVVALRVGGTPIRIMSSPLGKGNAGLVYATTDGQRVVKMPRANWWAVASLLDEAPSERFWARVGARAGFTVPRTECASRAGLYAVRRRLHDESLGDFLTRRRLFVYNPRTREYVAARPVEALAADADLRIVWPGVKAMIDTMRDTPQFALSLAPSNVFVEYVRAGRRRVKRVGLVDVGPVEKAADSYGAMDSPITYLNYCAGRLTKYRRKGWVPTLSPGR
jgi:hypothetical protein